jgi:signal transduction histidine kinase
VDVAGNGAVSLGDPVRKEEDVKTGSKFFAILAATLVSVSAVAEGEYGTADEAKAMLERAVEAVKEKGEEALALFSKGEDGFKDRDLYPYCGGPDGNFTAHPSLVGKSLKDLQDKTGKPFGAEIYEVASDGEISEVAYMWPRPGEEEPVQKSAYVTKVDDQICAVGYYIQ